MNFFSDRVWTRHRGDWLPGCGDGDSNSNPSGPSTATGPTISIVGQNGTRAFTPNPASFGGQTVVFKNNDSIPHRVV